MTTFLSILFVLLTINVLLLVFSVNGAKEFFTKYFQRIAEIVLIKLFQREYSEGKYKEVV